jgi:uncharacterized protein YndB with AHSA1/START domain
MSRSIDLDIEVPGTPEEVWEAVATGPGITAWFVPATVEPREGGEATFDFGPGLGVDHSTVTAWDPPRRFVGESTTEGQTFAAEWLVEAKGEGTCVVRLIFSGFGDGAEWDDQYDGTTKGWQLFMYNLRLYLTHFRGQPCRSVLVHGSAGDIDLAEAWPAVLKAVGFTEPQLGEELSNEGTDAPTFGGRVERVTDNMVTFLLDQPGPGVGVVGAERYGGSIMTMVYLWLFGDDAATTAGREEPRWRRWMQEHFPPAPPPA